MKTILGLDLGTNSIGWALIQQDFNNKQGEIIGMGSRIIPMSQDIIGEFGKGNSISQTAERTAYRGVRRLRERHLLRRERLHRVLNILGFLPVHYANKIDFTKRLGKFIKDSETKFSFDREFIFKDSFNEMLEDFKQNHPDFLKNKYGENGLVPYDWTIYFLRKKALTKQISKQELAWVILNFNQKRGYFQLRGEDDEKIGIKEYVEELKIVDVIEGEFDKKNKNRKWYTIVFDNGFEYNSVFTTKPDWLNTSREFLITEETDELGNIKIVKDKKTDSFGREKRKITPLPSFDEIALMSKKDQDKFFKKIKLRTELTIENSNKTVGEYIYENLLLNPKQKIKGKLVRTIERKFYKAELEKILKKQAEFHSEFQNDVFLNNCIRELYKNNQQHQNNLVSKDLIHLLLNDIIFYQRPLRSQKSLIANCSLESRISKDDNGNEVARPLKVIAKSNPYFQEFRLLQWLQNLEIYTTEDDLNVTNQFISSIEDKETLFQFLTTKKEVEQKHIIEFLLKLKNGGKKLAKGEIEKYRWNYVQDKKYPMYETRHIIKSKLDKVNNLPANFLSFEIEMALWHIIYSVNDKIEYEKAIEKFAIKHHLEVESFAEAFKKVPPFKSEYGAYSEKGIKKLLPLMRFGKYWKYEFIDDDTRIRIEKILSGEYDENIKNRVRELVEKRGINSELDFYNLPLWFAQYIVYNRHSEAAVIGKWSNVSDLENYLKDFKQHSLRNPIVEQVITETLRVVKDIWQQFGNGAKDFFSEIHIELGREMKNTADERKRLSSIVTENENTNYRIKALLAELALDNSVENVRPYSPVQQEILKIYEDGVLKAQDNIEDDILKISKTAQPSSTDLKRYKLWLEQKYMSPYTGQIIPLNKLFTPAYEIEHIIPQSRYFDDSLSNKVICEAAVNKLKDNQIGLAFIKNHHGEKVQLGDGKVVSILEVNEYEAFVKKYYNNNRTKRNKLLLEDIPEKMIERQLNDTRYISKYISQLLSNIVRNDQPDSKDDGVNSINILPGNGKITTQLKQDWGLNDVWNELILPRFERMNALTQSTDFTSLNTNGKLIPTVPLELSKGFNKKRIDHRHHALDALVIACATRDHINFLNNESALSKKNKTEDEKQSYRFDLKAKLCEKKYNENSTSNYKWVFKKPWDTFTQDARSCLEKIVVSFKQNIRVINKATNYFESYRDEDGNIRLGKDGKPIKGIRKQEGTNWAIRKSLHKETVSGKIQLERVKVAKGKILTATRKLLDSSFNEKSIGSITDTGIQKILLNYLKAKSGVSEIAFSPEGIEELNKNIKLYNDGKSHQPILKVRVFEQGSKFQVGYSGNKSKKYVEAAKGTNLFFAIYQDKDGKRSYATIPLNEVIERQKQGLISVPETNEKGHHLLMTLSPNDLVYVPTDEEMINMENLNLNNIYKLTDSSDTTCNFIPAYISQIIFNINKKDQEKIGLIYPIQNELGLGSPQSKNQKSFNELMIKEVCIKLKIDRLGNILNK